MKNHKGFTLIELLIVIAVIAIIAAIAIPNLMRSRIRANEAAAVAAVKEYAASGAAGVPAARLGYHFMLPAGAAARGAGLLAIPDGSGSTGTSIYYVDAGGRVWARGDLAPGAGFDALAGEFGAAANNPAGMGADAARAAGWVAL